MDSRGGVFSEHDGIATTCTVETVKCIYVHYTYPYISFSVDWFRTESGPGAEPALALL